MKVLLCFHALVTLSNHRLAEELSRAPGIELHVLTPTWWPEESRNVYQEKASDPHYAIHQAPIAYWRTPMPNLFAYRSGLARAIRAVQPDIIDSYEEPFSLVSGQTLAVRQALAPRSRLIFYSAQNIYKHYPPPFNIIEEATFRSASAGVVCNSEVATVLRRKGYTGPLSYIPLAADANVFQPAQPGQKRQMQLALGLDPGRPTVGFLGRLHREKGLEVLLNAAATLPDVQLLIVGDGPHRQEIEARAQVLGIAGRALFTGAVSRLDTPAYLHCMDVLAVPSLTTKRWKEQFGRIIVEAAMCGLPVVGSSSGAIPDVVGRTGLIVPEGDAAALSSAITRLLADPARTAAMAQAARHRALQEFTWEQVARRRAELYEAVLSHPEGSAATRPQALGKPMNMGPKGQRGHEDTAPAQRDDRPLVLFANHTGHVSGAEISLLGLVSHLDLSLYRVAVACPSGTPLAHRLQAAGVPQTEWAPASLGFTRTVRGICGALLGVARAGVELRSSVRAMKPAVVHANSIRAALFSIEATIFTPARLVVHVRDDLPRDPVSLAVRAVLHYAADEVLAVSRYTLRGFRLHLPGGAHYAVLHDGVDPTRFSPSAGDNGASLRAELGIEEGSPLFAVVGQLTPWKGHEDAIRALALLPSRHSGASLLVVGEAKFTHYTARYNTRQYRLDLQTLAKELGLENRVLFTGERSDIPALMQALTALLVPSWSEPFGIVVGEAMAAGKPVVATRYGGPADVITSGVDGILVEPRRPEQLVDALVMLLDNPAGARAMGVAARSRVKRSFTVGKQARKLERVYASLLRRRNTRRGVRA